MAAKGFSEAEWQKINACLRQDPQRFGFPKRVYGSLIMGSFNIRKLGAVAKRSEETWAFLANICDRFDLIAIQETLEDLEGLRELKRRMGPAFGMIVSDATGVFPGDRGLAERMVFLYNRRIVERTDIATDVTYDRSKVLKDLAGNLDPISDALQAYSAYLQALKAHDPKGGEPKPKKPKIKMPSFLSFIRQPFCVSFRISGHPESRPLEVMAINAHLYYGNYITDRRQEFDALMNWILARVREDRTNYAKNFLLLGDLNLDFDNPKRDRPALEKHMKSFNSETGQTVRVYFPFLDPHPNQETVFKTNARENQTFDQIGFFSSNHNLPTHLDHDLMGQRERGPDYGVFNFVELFSTALLGKPLSELEKAEKITPEERKKFYRKFEHNVSDHMPLWFRLPLPDE